MAEVNYNKFIRRNPHSSLVALLFGLTLLSGLLIPAPLPEDPVVKGVDRQAEEACQDGAEEEDLQGLVDGRHG